MRRGKKKWKEKKKLGNKKRLRGWEWKTVIKKQEKKNKKRQREKRKEIQNDVNKIKNRRKKKEKGKNWKGKSRVEKMEIGLLG